MTLLPAPGEGPGFDRGTELNSARAVRGKDAVVVGERGFRVVAVQRAVCQASSFPLIAAHTEPTRTLFSPA